MDDTMVSVSGKLKDGKMEVDEVSINDGKNTTKYRRVEEVPEEMREAVKALISRTEKGSTPVEGEKLP
jgi:hypothetical protein